MGVEPRPFFAQSIENSASFSDDDRRVANNVIEAPLKCQECEEQFTGSDAVRSLKDHLERTHDNRRFSLPNNNINQNHIHRSKSNHLVDHEEEAAGKASRKASPVIITANDDLRGPFRCDKCSSSFSDIDHLEKHLLLHSPTSQSCRVCNKSFANVYRLQRHMISHDESAILRKFKCPECEKAFKFKHHLKEHIRIHSGEKPFECPNCGKRFSHSGSYSSHMTSKKCLVVNLKVRRSVDRPPRGRRSSHNNNNNLLRPIIPKYGDEHQDVFMNNGSVGTSSHVPSPVTVSSYLGHNDPYPPPAAAAMLTSCYSQPSMQPFLPNPSLSSLSLHPLLASFHNSGVSANPYHLPSSIASSLAAMAATFPDFPQVLRQENSYRSKDSQLDKINRDESRSPTTFIEHNSGAKTAIEKECKIDEDKQNIKAVQKILEIVDATAKEQQKHLLPESPIGKDSNDEKVFKSEVDEDGFEDCKHDDSFGCSYCDTSFKDSVTFHQHKKFDCSNSKDFDSQMNDSRLNPIAVKTEIKSEVMDHDFKHGSSTGTGDSDEDSARDNIDEDNSNTEEGRKWRVRSLFSEEHLRVLKTFYKINPRPKKYDVEKLANQIGFATRVVQVWFQNMRARDRRRGRHIQVPYYTSGANNQNPSRSFPSSNQMAYPSLVSSYNGVSSPSELDIYYAQHSPHIVNTKSSSPLPCRRVNSNGQCPSPSSSPKNLPSKASLNSLSSPGSANEGSSEDQPLDLSMKPVKDEPEDSALDLCQKPSYTSMPSKESNNSGGTNGVNRIDISAPVENFNKERLSTPASQLLSSLKSRSMYSNHDKNDVHYLQRYRGTTLSSLQHILSIPPVHPLSEHASLPTSSFNHTNNHHEILHARSDGAHSPVSYSHSEYNSDDALIIDDGTSKNIAKRPWQHIECSADDSIEDDALKQNKPWKQQKILDGMSMEDGMYSCDQCDKMFSKQSSLARHKYEHSGQRPHKCEQCGKAFKHKHHLTEHRRLHSGEKPFQCKKCLKRFSHSGSYSQHMNHRYSYCKPYRE
ncbi:Zinc finger E-box-binding homeobox protein zag-1 [Nymphon striatum]|nr:Zinc finger E-box-binding homeobox protein zag-1 [Nymphon striatum]